MLLSGTTTRLAPEQGQALLPVADLDRELNFLQSLQRYNHYNSNFFRNLPTAVSATWYPLIRPTYLYPAAAATAKQLVEVLVPVRESFTCFEQAQIVERIRAAQPNQLPAELYTTIVLPDGSSVSYLDAAKYFNVARRAA